MTKVYKNLRNQIIGILGDDLIFRKKVRSSYHLMKMYDAWGIQKNIVEGIIKKGCNDIRLLDTDTLILYKITPQEFMDKAIEKNWGDGVQLFVPRNNWVQINPRQQTLV